VVILSIVGQNNGIEGVALGVFIAIFFNFCLMAEISLKHLQVKRRKFIAVHFSSILLGILILLFIPLNQILELYNISVFLKLLINGMTYITLIISITLINPQFFLGKLSSDMLHEKIMKKINK